MRAGVFGPIGGGYPALRAAAINAARRNNASLWFAGAPSDLSGFVYQDSIGATPATGTDQIGLLLDRSYGAGNLVSQVLTPWTPGVGWSVAGNTLTYAGTGSTVVASQNVLTNGKYYRLNFSTSADIRLYVGSITTQFFNAGTYSVVLQAANTGSVRFDSQSTPVVVTVTAVYEVLGYPALQATAANKPTLELQANGYYGMRFDGSNDFLGFDGTRLVNSEYTVITAAAYENTSLATRSVVGGSNSTANTNLLVGSNTARLAFSQWGNDLFGPATYVDNTPTVMSAVLSASGKTIYSGGASIASDAVNTKLVSYAGASIGQGNQGPFLAMLGRVWLVAVTPVNMPPADRIAIERFAALLSGAAYA